MFIFGKFKPDSGHVFVEEFDAGFFESPDNAFGGVVVDGNLAVFGFDAFDGAFGNMRLAGQIGLFPAEQGARGADVAALECQPGRVQHEGPFDLNYVPRGHHFIPKVQA